MLIIVLRVNQIIKVELTYGGDQFHDEEITFPVLSQFFVSGNSELKHHLPISGQYQDCDISREDSEGVSLQEAFSWDITVFSSPPYSTKFSGISENGQYSDLLIPDLFLSPAAEFAEDVYPMSNVIINKLLAEKENLRGSNEALEEEELWAGSEHPCDLEQGLKLSETNVFLPYKEELAQRFLSCSIFLISKGSIVANDTKTPCSKHLTSMPLTILIISPHIFTILSFFPHWNIRYVMFASGMLKLMWVQGPSLKQSGPVIN